MASFRLSFALWYHSSTFPYPTAQGDGQWAAVIPWYLLFAFSSLSHCSSALVWVLQERPVPPWAFSSKEIFPCSSMGQERGYPLQCALYRHCRKSLLQRCLLSGAAPSNRVLHQPYRRNPCTWAGFGMAELWELTCGRDSSIPGSLRARVYH